MHKINPNLGWGGVIYTPYTSKWAPKKPTYEWKYTYKVLKLRVKQVIYEPNI